MNQYKAFGLNIASEYELDELVPDCDGAPDLIIQNGRVPDVFGDHETEKPERRIQRDAFCLSIPQVAKYSVGNGAQILIEPYSGASLEEIKLYLLGSCMGALLYQRRTLPLHGSCINIGGKGVLLTGKSGAGKSTIASALYRKGYRMITDDVAAVRVGEFNEVIVYPGYPGQKLWEDALERLGGREEKRPLNRISRAITKYAIKSHAWFCHQEVPLRFIFEIVPQSLEQIKLEEIKLSEKLKLIMKNTYRPCMPAEMGLKEWHFQQSVAVANQVKAYRISRPLDQPLEKNIADILLENVV
ncbi:MAG: hypothetical protein KBA53_04975 [Thermoclostridium sp.]|nr:hypothetical protein [Thermoclostridium sp.]